MTKDSKKTQQEVAAKQARLYGCEYLKVRWVTRQRILGDTLSSERS